MPFYKIQMISEKCLPILLMIWPGIYSGWFVLWPSLSLPELSNHPGKKSAGLRKFRCRVNTASPSCWPATLPGLAGLLCPVSAGDRAGRLQLVGVKTAGFICFKWIIFPRTRAGPGRGSSSLCQLLSVWSCWCRCSRPARPGPPPPAAPLINGWRARQSDLSSHSQVLVAGTRGVRADI